MKLAGAGRDDDYSKDHGFSHDAKDIKKTFDLFENIVQYWPETKEELLGILHQTISTKEPAFISLKR